MQSDSRNSLRRRLSYLSAVDFLPIAEQALLRAFTSGGAASGAAPAGGAGGAAGGNRGGAGATAGGGAQAGRNAGGTSSSQFGSGGGGGRSGGGGGGQGTITSGLADPDNNVAPQPLLVGRTLLVADTITNSIVVQGPPASLEIVSRLLDEIDVKAEQVMISCVFGQLALGKDLNIGVDYLRLLNNDIAGRGGSGAFTPLPVDGTTSFIPAPLTGALNGLGVYGKIGDWRVMLNALDQSSRFEVLSRPTVFMANNQKGTISSPPPTSSSATLP
jgi:type II secretory pathway component GspD/PulD (secretin)